MIAAVAVYITIDLECIVSIIECSTFWSVFQEPNGILLNYIKEIE